MPNLTNVKIGKGKAALDSQSYAALWGSTTPDGALFYNVSSAPLDQLGWTFDQWFAFADAIARQRYAVHANPPVFDPTDYADLDKLHRWATRNARRIRDAAAEKARH